jgi:hypothetical protein
MQLVEIARRKFNIEEEKVRLREIIESVHANQ